MTYYLFSKTSKECVYLGKRLEGSPKLFEGPIVFLGNKRYLLNESLLKILISQFIEKNTNCIVCTSYELLETNMFLEEDEFPIEIGGDRDFDLPLNTYLPELNHLDKVLSQLIHLESG